MSLHDLERYPLPPFDPAVHRMGGICLKHPEANGQRYIRNGQCLLCHREIRSRHKARNAAPWIKRHIVGMSYDEGVLVLKGLLMYHDTAPSEASELMITRFKMWLRDVQLKTGAGL